MRQPEERRGVCADYCGEKSQMPAWCTETDIWSAQQQVKNEAGEFVVRRLRFMELFNDKSVAHETNAAFGFLHEFYFAGVLDFTVFQQNKSCTTDLRKAQSVADPEYLKEKKEQKTL